LIKSFTLFREIIPQSFYFNIFRELIIYLRDLIKSPFSSFPCDIYIVICLQVYSYVLNVKGAEKQTKLLHQRPLLSPTAVYTVSVKDKVTRERTTLRVFRGSLLVIIPPMLPPVSGTVCSAAAEVPMDAVSPHGKSEEESTSFFMGTEDSLPVSR
jgi:hypothetical protein